MAESIGRAVGRIKSRFDGYLERHLPEHQVEAICVALGHTWRRRVLSPAASVRLMLIQVLAGVALSGLRHVAKLDVSAQAICEARKRLPLGLLARLVERLAAGAARAPSSEGASPRTLWRGLRVWVADGMSFLTPDTPELAAQYRRPVNQRGVSKSAYPAPKLLCLLDHAGGLITRAIPLPWGRQEQTCLSRLFRWLSPGDLLIGDRGLVSFAHLALLRRSGVAGLMRLPKDKRVGGRGKGRGKGRRRLVRRLGRQDLLVRWERTARPRSWVSALRWRRRLPRSLTLRQVAFRVRRKGCRDRWVWLITTLSDPEAYPAKDLAELYGRRWHVEVCFRDLKKTLGMSRLSARGVGGVRKELLAFVLLYNLVRLVMAEAAERQGVEPGRVSFVDALRWLLWSEPGEGPPRLRVNKRRLRPAEPRLLKTGGKRYGPLNSPRAALRRPPAEVIL